jgi:membrane-bound lytic murein transglycosylase D
MNLTALAPARLIRPSWVLLLAAFLSGCATSVPSPQPPIERLPAAEAAPTTPTPAAMTVPPVKPAPPVPATVSGPAVPLAPAVTEMNEERPVALKPYAILGLQEPIDIWERIRRGFAMPDLNNPLVRNREQWYASRPDYMLRMTERSRPYLFHIVEELEAAQACPPSWPAAIH